MKIFSATIIAIAICLIGFNIVKVNWSAPFEKESSAYLIGILTSLCAIVIMLILSISRKIAKKLKE